MIVEETNVVELKFDIPYNATAAADWARTVMNTYTAMYNDVIVTNVTHRAGEFIRYM
jgi:hypothetical protein